MSASNVPTAKASEYLSCPPWDRREALVREQKALGFYVSGHPLDRYLKGDRVLAKLGAAQTVSCHQMDDWAVVKVVGMVEGYRERIFKDGGGKVAFFDLEDLWGRLTVKVRGQAIDNFASVLTSGEPVIVTGKVSFPHRGDDAAEEPDDAAREATLLLNDVVPLVSAIRADATGLAIKLPLETTVPSDFESIKQVLAGSPGDCPVSLILTAQDGGEALLGLPSTLRVEVGDHLFSGLEKIFGKHVAELR